MLAAVLCAVGLIAGTAPALADGGAPTGSDRQVAQTLGDRELTVIIRRAAPVPGAERVEVVSHAGTPPGTLGLRLARDGVVVSRGAVTLGDRPGSYPATLSVDRPGPWELAVDDGSRVARIPFVVAAPVVSPGEWAGYGGFVAAGVLLLVALAAAHTRRGWAALVPAAGVVAALAVGVTGALLSASVPPPPQPGAQLDPTVGNVTDPYAALPPSSVDYSRPPANMVVRAPGATAGRPVDVELTLADGATGRPVDDLLVHDDALIHLVVVGPAGELWHRHPIRVGPGDYRVPLVPPEPGDYAVAAELARRGGGGQLLRATLPVALDAGAAEPWPDEAGPPATVTVRGPVGGPTAAAPSTITARFGGPADLQPWLGMLGHLVVVGPLPDTGAVGAAAAAAPVWAHVHAMAPATPSAPGGPPDETVAGYGPDVDFTYTFPLPGRYRLWAQAERGYAVLTAPAVVDVSPADGAGR